ncbi:MAG: hypothetical protein ACTHJ0_15205 [Flavipsychrobacter sp.]
MPKRTYLFLTIVFHIICQAAYAQTIQGEVLNMDDKRALTEVTITNVFNNKGTASDTAGKFVIPADKGELLEFKKDGYKTVRVRIPQSYVPSYFKIIMEKGSPNVEQLYAGNDWKTDSFRTHELYAKEINYPKMSVVDKMQHPFDAMSKHNREIWAFQKDFEATEQEKYVNYKFNPKLISNITGLQGDSLQAYIRRYKPSYQMVRSLDEYSLYSYIRNTAYRFRHRFSPGRNAR